MILVGHRIGAMNWKWCHQYFSWVINLKRRSANSLISNVQSSILPSLYRCTGSYIVTTLNFTVLMISFWKFLLTSTGKVRLSWSFGWKMFWELFCLSEQALSLRYSHFNLLLLSLLQNYCWSFSVWLWSHLLSKFLWLSFCFY